MYDGLPRIRFISNRFLSKKNLNCNPGYGRSWGEDAKIFKGILMGEGGRSQESILVTFYLTRIHRYGHSISDLFANGPGGRKPDEHS